MHIYLLFLAGLRDMWDLGSLARVEPAPLALKAQSLNHWTTREVPPNSLIWISYSPSDFSYHLYQRFLSGAFGWTSEFPSALWNIRKSFSSVQSLSRVQLFATPWTAALQASLSITNYQSPPKPMSIELVMPSSHLILCHPLLLLPSVFHSVRIFSSESALCIRWPKYWSFSFNISPSNERPGLISFRMDWLDLLAVQGTLKSLLQHHSSKASILQCSAFFIVQLSHPYMTTGKLAPT